MQDKFNGSRRSMRQGKGSKYGYDERKRTGAPGGAPDLIPAICSALNGHQVFRGVSVAASYLLLATFAGATTTNGIS